jgi:hypothetical protein
LELWIPLNFFHPSAIVGIHGAGMTHLIFSSKNAPVLEIAPATESHIQFKQLFFISSTWKRGIFTADLNITAFAPFYSRFSMLYLKLKL